jgi:vacuolar-type H+-ATPase subunit F/Vma7
MVFHIIGDEDTIVGYRFAGVTGTPVSDAAAASRAFGEALSDKQCRVLLLTEQVADWIEAEVVAHRLKAVAPYIVEVGDVWETKVARRSLEEMIQEAVGIKIVHEKD